MITPFTFCSKSSPQLIHLKNVLSILTNKVNIEFLRDQLDKALIDVEKLKDKVRKNGNGSHDWSSSCTTDDC